MALMHEVIDLNGTASSSASGIFGAETKGAFLNRAVWALFDLTKDQTIKFTVWGLPVSIKVERFRPIIERWVGPEAVTQ